MDYIAYIQYELPNSSVLYFEKPYSLKEYLKREDAQWPARVYIKGEEVSILTFIYWVVEQC